MNSNFDPRHFSGQLSFIWFQSAEARRIKEAIGKIAAQMALSPASRLDLLYLVLATLRKIGLQKFRRHYEVQRVSMAGDLGIYEIKFQVIVAERDSLLRLYVVLDSHQSLVVGLCFREKKIAGTKDATRSFQNQDIEAAMKLARQYWSSLHDSKEDV